jgi:hypothetical protein
MSKFLLNLLVQISKALVYSKIKFYSKKNFPVTFGPSGLSTQPWPILFFPNRPYFSSSPPPLGLGLTAGLAHPHGPTGHLLIPPALEPSAHSAAGRARATPRVDPDTSTRRKENGRINLLYSPINQRHFPLFNNR